jgi:tetratricopeptide (TPR) repeat protein
LIRASDGFHLWSEIYNRELKDIFAVQEDIATAVADELKITLGIDQSLRMLGGTDNIKAYDLYLVARGQYNVNDTLALKSLDAALALDPKFALAWASKSIIHTFFTITDPASRIAIEKEMGLDAAQKAIELEPNLAAGYYSLGYAKSTSGDFIEAGLAYRKAMDLTNEPLSFIMPVVVIHYLVVGYFERANELLDEMLQNDPFNSVNLGWRLWILGMRGETQRVEEEYERANLLFGDRFASDNPAITDVRLGTRNNISRDDILFSDPICDAMKEHLESPKEGLAELRRFNIHDNNLTVVNLLNIVLWATYFGDPEYAIDVLEKTIRIGHESILFFYFPVMKEVRQTSRFKELIKEFGLVDYWNEFGWPDLCRPLDNGDFECD